MFQRRAGTLAILAVVLALGSTASAQTVAVAQLSGTVTDESGGALPGAEVTVTKTDTGFTRFVITGVRASSSSPACRWPL